MHALWLFIYRVYLKNALNWKCVILCLLTGTIFLIEISHHYHLFEFINRAQNYLFNIGLITEKLSNVQW